MEARAVHTPTVMWAGAFSPSFLALHAFVSPPGSGMQSLGNQGAKFSENVFSKCLPTSGWELASWLSLPLLAG